MTRRRHTCCVEGCTKDRKAWQATCEACFGRLRRHPEVRAALSEAHRTRDFIRRTAAGKEAGALLGFAAILPASPSSEPAPSWAERADLR